MLDYEKALKLVGDLVHDSMLKYQYKETSRTFKWIYEYERILNLEKEIIGLFGSSEEIQKLATRKAQLLHYITKYSKYVKAHK